MIAAKVTLVLALMFVVDARVYEKCQLARRLLRLDATLDEIGTWVCIANQAGFDTHKQTDKSHGIFQISEEWCSPSGAAGGKCHVRCSNLRDNNVSDDFRCARKIHKELGFDAWPVYETNCKENSTQSVDGCKVGLDNALGNGAFPNPFNNNNNKSRKLDGDNDDSSEYNYDQE